MDKDDLVNLTSRAWSLNILAQLHAGTPGRQAALLTATGASRTAFGQSLAHLIELGLLERNPGHGHPLRPEFRMTPKGAEAAEMAEVILRAGPDKPEAALLRRVWTVPVLSVCVAPRYFSDIKRDLPPITDRALSGCLKQLQARNWLSRDTETESHPPRPVYQAANAGLEIGEAVLRLAS